MRVADNASCSGCPIATAHPTRLFAAPKMGGLRLSVVAAPKDGSHRPQWTYAKSGLDPKEITVIGCINCTPASTCCAKEDSCKHKSFPTESKSRKWIGEHDAAAAVAHCHKQYLAPMLKARPWERIDLLGEQPLRRLGERNSIDKWRGSPIAVPQFDPTKLIAISTLDSTEVMKDQTMIPVVLGDLRKSLTIPPEGFKLYPSLTDVQGFTSPLVLLDIETPDYKKLGAAAPITIIGITKEPYRTMVVPVRGAYIPELKRIFSNAKELVTHNGLSFDVPRMKRDELVFSPDVILWDTILMHHLCFPDLSHKLAFVGTQFSSQPAWKDDRDLFELYCARDVSVMAEAFVTLKKLLARYDLENIYHNISVPLALICHLMEMTGFKKDADQLEKQRAKLVQEVEDLQTFLPEELRSYDKEASKRSPAPEGTLSPKTGKPMKFVMSPVMKRINPWKSDTVKKKYLYDTLELPKQFNSKTDKLSVDKVALAKLGRRTQDPVQQQTIETLKKLNKNAGLLSGFFATDEEKAKKKAKREKIEDFESLVVPTDRIHPRFNVQGTNSGRLSSARPNFQNQPPLARFMYVPSHPGWKIIEVDYSQAENRLTAFLAGDKERLKRFEDDPDFSEHKWAASLFFGIPYEEVEKDNDKSTPYGKSKPIVHGTNYGEGARKIAQDNDLVESEVKEMLVKWKMAIKETTAWQTRCAAQAKREGVLTTPFGRKRWFYTDNLHTQALSFIPQSTAADIIFRAMIAMMYERIKWPLEKVKKVVQVTEPLPHPAQLLVQVHDALVVECPEEMVPQVVAILKKVMEQPWPELDGFSLPVSVSVGDSWGTVEPYKPTGESWGEAS